MPESVSVDVSFSYLLAYKANLLLMLRSPLNIAASAIFPLAGLALVVLSLVNGQALDVLAIALVIVCVLFMPILLAFLLFVFRRRSPFRGEPIRYRFDAAGIHVATQLSSSTLKWAAIRSVVEKAGFMFLFIGPSRAMVLPMAQLQTAGVLEDLREIVRVGRLSD